MARVYVFFVVYSAGAGEEELSTETFALNQQAVFGILFDKRKIRKWGRNVRDVLPT